MKRTGIAHAIAILVIISAAVGLAGAMYFEAGGAVSQLHSHPPQVSTSDNLASLNLNFTLSYNTTNLVENHFIGITLSLQNDLDSPNNVTADNGAWATSPDVGLYACPGNQPYGFLIAQGYYSTSNATSATPLVLYEPGVYNCPAILQTSSYAFGPHGNMTSSLAVSGSWITSGNSSPEFEVFSPGVYTIVAVTEWGQVDILHFSVIPSGTTGGSSGFTTSTGLTSSVMSCSTTAEQSASPLPTSTTGDTTVIIPSGVGVNPSLNYQPANITVVVGVSNTITWVDQDNSSLNNVFFTSAPSCSSLPAPSQIMSSGSTFSVTLTTPGTYEYYSQFHTLWMHGTITIEVLHG